MIKHVAICKPLHYMTIMSNKLCKTMIICCWMVALMIILPPLSLGFHLEFCDSNVIDHFGCDASPLLKILSCSDTWLIEQMVIACSVLIFIITLICVVFSYIYIIKTILKFSFSKEKSLFYLFFPHDCTFHLYGSCIFIYVKPSAKEEMLTKVCHCLFLPYHQC